MLWLRKESAELGDSSDSTGLESSEGDPSTTGHTSPSSKATTSPPPSTDDSPTIFPTISLTEHTTSMTDGQPTRTTAVDSGTTESVFEPSSSPNTSQARPTTRTTDSHSISITTIDSGTTKSLPDSPSSSTMSKPGQTPTTDSIQPTTTTIEKPESTEPPPESSSLSTTSKAEQTPKTDDHSTPTATQISGSTDSPPESSSSRTTLMVGQSPTMSSSSFTSKPGQTPTTDGIQPMTTTTENLATTKSPPQSSSLPITSKAEQTPKTDDHSTPTTAENSGHIDSQPTSQSQLVVMTKVPDAGQNPQQSTRIDDPRPGSTGTAAPTDSTSIRTQGSTAMSIVDIGTTSTETNSMTQTRIALAAEQTVEVGTTTFVTTGVEDLTTTFTGDGFNSIITTRHAFTRTTISLVTNRPTDSTFASSRDSKAAKIAGGVAGGIMGLLTLAAMIFFLCRRRRRAGNNMPYSLVEPRGFSPGEVQTRELPPVRTVTPLLWQQHQPHASNESIVSVRDAGRVTIGSSTREVATNPFEQAASTHSLIVVASVRSSRNSLLSDPFEDNANSYLAELSSRDSFDAADLETGTLRESENGSVAASSSVTVKGQAKANRDRHLSNASTDCLYPVLEPDLPAGHVSINSGLSYATLDPERVAKLQAQPQLMRYSSNSVPSTSSSIVIVGYAV